MILRSFRLRGSFRTRPLVPVLIASLLPLGTPVVYAQTPPAAGAEAPAAAPEAAPAKTPEQLKDEARARFQRGLQLLREEAWAPALAEFLASRTLFPTRAATTNAGVSLRKLQRYDESLAMYETLLREFPDLPDADKVEAQRAIAELRALVGTVEVTAAEPGAMIVIDGRERAEFPTIEPLRVNAGSHTVRVFKEGYEPFETRVDVAGGQTAGVSAKLRALAESGRLKVVEQTGKALDVVVDNVTVGKTPWEGLLGVGDHTVVLRGEEGKTGTAPARVKVKKTETASIVLRAEELDASLRIEPVPVSAVVSIDAVPVGAGQWVGRLRSGDHRIEASADGFLSVTKTVNLAKNEHQNIKLELDRDEEAPVWRKPSKVTFELRGGLPFGPSLGGAPSDGCGSGCSANLALGGFGSLLGTYELGNGFGIGLSAGYLGIAQKTTGHDGDLTPAVNLAVRPASLNDDIGMGGFLLGALAGLHFGETFPITARVGVGGYFASLRTIRDGSFTARNGETVDLKAIEQKTSSTYVYIDPEVRVGYRIASDVEVAVGLSGLMLIAPSTPTWDDTDQVDAGPDGIGTYSDDALTGSFVFLPMPTVGLRYDY